MDVWYYFWIFSFAVAGLAFAAIALVVSIFGVADLQRMLSEIRAQQPRR